MGWIWGAGGVVIHNSGQLHIVELPARTNTNTRHTNHAFFTMKWIPKADLLKAFRLNIKVFTFFCVLSFPHIINFEPLLSFCFYHYFADHIIILIVMCSFLLSLHGSQMKQMFFKQCWNFLWLNMCVCLRSFYSVFFSWICARKIERKKRIYRMKQSSFPICSCH